MYLYGSQIREVDFFNDLEWKTAISFMCKSGSASVRTLRDPAGSMTSLSATGIGLPLPDSDVRDVFGVEVFGLK